MSDVHVLDAQMARLQRMAPLDRAKAAMELVDHHRRAMCRFAEIRSAAVTEAWMAGATFAEIAEHLAITAGRAHQLHRWNEMNSKERSRA